MGMVVRTNSMAMNANRQLGINNTQVGKSLEKLSSGFRINRAADDASGLAISEKMKAQIKGLETASANSQDGISLIQTAEGGAQEIHDMLNRMTELATKSANGTIQNDVDREAIQREVDDLNAEISRIASSTNFNGINLLDGNLSKGSSSNSATNSGIIDFGLSDTAKAGGAMNFTDATKGKFVGTALGNGAVATAAGDKFELQVFYKDENGADQSKKITLTAKDGTHLVAEDGTEYVTTATADKGELSDAFAAEMKKSDLGKLFDISSVKATGVLTFDAKTKGTAGASITTMVQTDDTTLAGTQATIATGGTKTAAVDKFDSLDISKFATWNGTDDLSKADVFSVNGSKFLFVDAGITTEQLAKLAPDITAITTQATGVVDDTDVAAATAAIANKTGLKATANAGNNTWIDFKPDPANSTTSAKGGLTLQVGDTNDSFNKVTVSVDDLSAGGIGTAGLDVSDQISAGNSIKTIKTAINKVSTNRANLGSLQNRLEHTINNLDTTAENMTAANSRIRDTDMAKEMMSYTKNNILTQAAQAMLAQANQQPQAILQLLQ